MRVGPEVEKMKNVSLPLLLAAAAVLLVAAGCGGEGAPAAGNGGPGRSAATFEFQNPLLLSKVDQWAEYRRAGDLTERLTVLSTDPSNHSLKIKRLVRDTAVNALRDDSVLTILPNHFLFAFERAGGVVTTVRHARIEHLGRTFDAFCVETLGRLQGRIESWYSNDVPVYGLIKQVRVKPEGRDILYELIDYSGR